MSTARILGITEDGNGCEHCGRPDLKRYVAVEHTDGQIGYYGTTCGPKVYGHEVWAEMNYAAAEAALDACPSPAAARSLLGFVTVCGPKRITPKFERDVADRFHGRMADRDAVVAVAIAAYRAGVRP